MAISNYSWDRAYIFYNVLADMEKAWRNYDFDDWFLTNMYIEPISSFTDEQVGKLFRCFYDITLS